MALSNWDKNEIKKLALISGRPLEVQCAEAFLKQRWKVRLGTFYMDFMSEKIRELDFLCERDFDFDIRNVNRDNIHWKFRLRILGSCKGFALEHCPATYSVSSGNSSIETPNLICYECGVHGRSVADAMRRRSAGQFLMRSGLQHSQQVIGFDILQRKEDARKQSQVEYARKTDRDLYDGLDSSIKAAIFWYREDRRQERLRTASGDSGYIALNIPLLVFSTPFWYVPIDNGTAGDPELKSSSYHVGLYPSGDSERPPEPVMSILWDVSKIGELTDHLNKLLNWFIDETTFAIERS